MGQAWCKERSSKAQDSKSPLDRVFLRCAHRLYPGLKEEGSALGGATQRVTSSEIGYAGSPPRAMLARGCSIDSVDRPFQPSDWVDVNLEVPNTPRASSAMTNRTLDTTIYHTTTPSSSSCNLKDVTPIAPPRRKKKIRDRPLPPKPDEASPSSDNSIEPLYSSINKLKTSNYMKNKHDCSNERNRTKEFYEHKINGTGKIIPSVIVSGWKSAERLSVSSHQDNQANKNGRLISTISLPNYDQLDASRHEENSLGDESTSRDEVDCFSEKLETEVVLDSGKTSTPMKNNSKKVDGCFLNSDGEKDSPVVEETKVRDQHELQGEKSRVQSFLYSEGSKDDLFFDAEDTKRTCSLDRHKEPELKKLTLLRRSLSSDSVDSADDKRLSAAQLSQTDSSPKNLTRSISEESFPSVLMEDTDDFFDEKIVKDTKNEITKIREELEAVKNEVKTPPSTPEPIIKPQFQTNDHSILLKVLRDESNESNLSSMTPSLNELEVALSDMLEKTDDNSLEIKESNNYHDNNSINDNNLLETPIEPKIVKIIKKNDELVDIDLNNDPTIVNGFKKTTATKIRSLDRNEQLNPPEKPSRLLRISLDSLINNENNIPTPPKRRNRSALGFKENLHNDRLI